MTKGGLLTTRSNASPVTGSNSEPSRRSHCWPDSAAVTAASSSARRLRSVATTEAACRPRCSAWTPHPVPRSSARATRSRGVMRASVSDAPPTPSTWSTATSPDERPAESGPWSLTTYQSVSLSPYGRTSTTARTCAPTSTSPSETRSARGSSRRTGSTGTCSPSTNNRASSASAPCSDSSARRAGTGSSRASAAYADAPSSASSPSAVKPASRKVRRTRSAAAWSTWSGARSTY